MDHCWHELKGDGVPGEPVNRNRSKAVWYHFADTHHPLAKPYDARMRLNRLAAHFSGAPRVLANDAATVFHRGLHGRAVEYGVDLVEAQENPSNARACTRSLVGM